MRNDKLKALLIKSLDFELSADEQAQLETGLSASDELRQEKAQLLAMRQLIGSIEPNPNPTFAQNVIAKIQAKRKAGFSASVIQLLPRVAAACIVLLLISLFSIYLSEGTLSVDAIVGVQELSIDEAYSLTEY